MFHIPNRFLAYPLIIFSFSTMPVNASAAAAASSVDPMATDPRHMLVKKVRVDFATEITSRQIVLGTSNSAVALVDMAREYLETAVDGPCDYIPLHPNWALVIRYVLLGYGYDKGVAETLKTSDAEQPILNQACAFSSAYLAAQEQKSAIRDEDIYGNTVDVLAVIASLKKLVAAVPDDIQEFAKENFTKLSYAKLHTFNAWASHERFWAVAGVLDPKTSSQLRTAFRVLAGTPFAFVTDLTNKLDHAIRGMAADPTAQSVVDLVQLSQQVLMTLAAGVPGDADAWVRLNPSNAGEWEIIRKALFLALSVTSNPETSGNTFLSTLYNCGSYFHKKIDPDAIKTYNWRLEAFAKGFSKVWQGLKGAEADAAIQTQLVEVVKQSDPLLRSIGQRPTIERGASYAVLSAAYDTSIKAINLGIARAELAASIALYPKLKHDQAFRALYPDLINWVTYHEPSPRAHSLVSGAVTRLTLPASFTPQGIQLAYQGGKWILKALQLDGKGNSTSEAILWRQGTSATETFVGELTNSQGLHLFSFSVNDATATIKAISSGYHTKIGGDSTTVTVAHGQEIGVIESSAYPLHTDYMTDNIEDAAISIKAKSYLGMRGILAAKRDSVWVNGSEIINCWNYQGYEEKRTGNGHAYRFFSPQEHGAQAHKDVIFFSDDIHATFATFLAGQDVCLLNNNSSTKYAVTHGSIIKAGNSLFITHGGWHSNRRYVYAGWSHDPDYRPPRRPLITEAEAAFESPMALLEYGRSLVFNAHYLLTLNQEERAILYAGPHVYGAYQTIIVRGTI